MSVGVAGNAMSMDLAGTDGRTDARVGRNDRQIDSSDDATTTGGARGKSGNGRTWRCLASGSWLETELPAVETVRGFYF